MINFKINPLSSDLKKISFKQGENLDSLAKRSFREFGGVPTSELLEHFIIFVNQKEIPKEMWITLTVDEDAEVLITLRLTGGSFGQTFKVVALAAILIATTAVLGPMAGQMGLLMYTGAMVAISFGSTLLLNALIPPLEAGGMGSFSLPEYEDSQMFSITNQSNTTKKYGAVPRVYGTHRMFPFIAATPYVEYISNADGVLEQYYTALYDFGIGVNQVVDLKIGDTLLAEFVDVEYGFVDINKPASVTTSWESKLATSFSIYKGVNYIENFSVNINGNKNEGDPESEYQVTRNAPTKDGMTQQDIQVVLVAPQGLNSYATTGVRGTVDISIEVLWADVGSSSWAPIQTAAEYTLGGAVEQSSVIDTYLFNPTAELEVIPKTAPPAASGLDIVATWQLRYVSVDYPYYATLIYQFGLAAGRTQLRMTEYVPVGTSLTLAGGYIGEVASISGAAGDYTVNLVSAIPAALHLFNVTWDNNLVKYVVCSVDIWIRGFDGLLFWPYGWWEQDHYEQQTSTIPFKGATQSAITVSGDTTTPLYSTIKAKFYDSTPKKIRVNRLDTVPQYTYQQSDNLTLLSISTRIQGSPIAVKSRHSFMEFRIKATDQLNGAIQNLSGVVTSILDVYDDGSGLWTKEATNNPAWVFCDLLTGEMNKRPIAKSRIHTDSILEWAAFNEEIPDHGVMQDAFTDQRYQTNYVLDFASTVQDALGTVANAAQASLNMVNGKYGVLLDKERTIPVQVFTPRNVKSFSSSRKYYEPPHALKVKYVDPNADWQQLEAVVYQDGYTELTAETFEDIEAFACTSYEQAWRYGRYMMAQSQLRQETINIEVDFENLVCTRGDYVLFTNDVMKVGGIPSRVRELAGVEVTTDEEFVYDPLLSYGYTFRSNTDGALYTGTLTVTGTYTADLTGDLPEVGDLFIYGEVDLITYECLVKAITPVDDLSAGLVLVEKADAVYSAHKTMVLPDYDPQISILLDSNYIPPAVEDLTVVENFWRCNGSAYEYYIDLSWTMPDFSVYSTFEIYINGSLEGFTNDLTYTYLVPTTNLGIELTITVIAVTQSGNKLPVVGASNVAATPVSKVTPPTSVTALYLNVTGEVLQLEWPPISDCDLDEYLIRYSPISDAIWENSTPLMTASRNTSMVSTQARTGTYLVKAIDRNSNISADAAKAITSIPNLFNLNVVDELDDFPALLGSKEDVVDLGGSLILNELVSGGPGITEYVSEGTYFYEDLLDLGDIYTVRLQSNIESEGYTEGDLMVNWATLSDVDSMSTIAFSDWDVEAYVRSRDSYNVIANWLPMGDVLYMREGDEDDWSEWRKLTIGDFTGRVFEFKLILKSYKPSVSPNVTGGVIKADMPDRMDSYDNVSAPSGGYTLTYDIAFKGPGTTPAIQITQDDAETGDYYKITNKLLTGFDIQFYDKTDTVAARQFDAMVRGFGRKALSSI